MLQQPKKEPAHNKSSFENSNRYVATVIYNVNFGKLESEPKYNQITYLWPNTHELYV